jgi:hypothetical protein
LRVEAHFPARRLPLATNASESLIFDLTIANVVDFIFRRYKPHWLPNPEKVFRLFDAQGRRIARSLAPKAIGPISDSDFLISGKSYL